MICLLGASGGIGSALLEALLARQLPVRALVRTGAAAQRLRARGCEAVVGDLLNVRSLDGLVRGVETVYYLVHMLRTEPFARDMTPGAAEARGLANLLSACRTEGVAPRLIYLGGLARRDACMVHHAHPPEGLLDTVRTCGLPYTILLSAPVIAPAGELFRLLHALTTHNRIIPLVQSSTARTQPIALSDLLAYLLDCRGEPLTVDDTFDVGGPETLTVEAMLRELAATLELKRGFVRVPLTDPALAARLLAFLTGLPGERIRSLLEDMRADTLCRDMRLQTILPRRLLGFRDSVRALAAPPS